MKLDVLALGAHPDDVEMSCTGTLLASMAVGKQVGIVDFTRGELGTRGTPAIRAEEAAASNKILGIDIRTAFPEEGPLIGKSPAYALIQKLGNFWKAVSGDEKVENRRALEEV